MNNKVFYQHPNLMRALGMHETVMEVMVNVLSGGESKVSLLYSAIGLQFNLLSQTSYYTPLKWLLLGSLNTEDTGIC